MTMSLVRGMTTTNTKKRKKRKLTLQQITKYEQEMRAYNKKMRQLHAHDQQMDLEQYIAYCFGEYKPKASSQANTYKPTEGYRRETQHIPSSNTDSFAPCVRKEPQQYTGERQLLGIATMHKSNMVPVFADQKEQAKEIAQMRRN